MDTNKANKLLTYRNIELFDGTIKEILVENQIIVSEEQKTRQQQLEKLIDDDFEQHDKVFKALA